MINLAFRTRISSIIPSTCNKKNVQEVELLRNTPIIKNNKCVGYINAVDIENDECHGLLFIDKLIPQFTQNNNEIISLTIEI